MAISFWIEYMRDIVIIFENVSAYDPREGEPSLRVSPDLALRFSSPAHLPSYTWMLPSYHCQGE